MPLQRQSIGYIPDNLTDITIINQLKTIGLNNSTLVIEVDDIVNDPPVSDYITVIVGENPTGIFTNKTNQIATKKLNNWSFINPLNYSNVYFKCTLTNRKKTIIYRHDLNKWLNHKILQSYEEKIHNLGTIVGSNLTCDIYDGNFQKLEIESPITIDNINSQNTTNVVLLTLIIKQSNGGEHEINFDSNNFIWLPTGDTPTFDLTDNTQTIINCLKIDTGKIFMQLVGTGLPL